VFFGLFYENELCAAMSLGRHSRQTDTSRKEITLDRRCFKDSYQVIGGSSKLFNKCLNWAKNNGYKKIISFSDNRWSLGNVYLKMGFILEKEYGPDYSYVEINNPRKRLSKQSQNRYDMPSQMLASNEYTICVNQNLDESDDDCDPEYKIPTNLPK
jgi:hypothetical protein